MDITIKYTYALVRVYVYTLSTQSILNKGLERKGYQDKKSNSNIVSYVTAAISSHIEFQDFSLPCVMGHLYKGTIIPLALLLPDQKAQLEQLERL